MEDDDLRASTNIEDRRGLGPVSGGGLGIGAILVLGLIGWATGIDPLALIQGAETLQQQQAPAQQQGRQGTPTDATGQFVARILGETEDVWTAQLPAQTGRPYTPPTLVLFTGATRSGCGMAGRQTGPFYCPPDRKLYLDTSFFQDMEQKYGGGGHFPDAYVIAHEVGHHIQNLLGILTQAQQREQSADRATANAISVRVELMADCLAGVWAHAMNDRHHNITADDARQAVATASAIGDDRLQQQATGQVVPDSFTHGTAEQRARWLQTGLDNGQVAACDTFKAPSL